MEEIKIIIEQEKKPGVSYAIAKNGLELPIIDITHPAFMVNPDEKQIKELEQKFIKDQSIPGEALLPFFKKSILGRGLLASIQTYLSGMITYMMKLGPDNLGKGYANDIDKAIAGGLGAMTFRLRLQDMAHVLAEGVKPELSKKPGVQMNFVNIAGGPSMDTLNALILLNKETPEIIRNRDIKIHILDMDDEGPDFALNSLNALKIPGAALDGVNAEIIINKHDWTKIEHLKEYLKNNIREGQITVFSSEGGLFDYSPDDVLFENLRAINSCTADVILFAGTLFRGYGVELKNNSSVIKRSLEEFSRSALDCGWRIEKNFNQPQTTVFGMRKENVR